MKEHEGPENLWGMGRDRCASGQRVPGALALETEFLMGKLAMPM